MKYALVNGERREAERDLSGQCPCCGSPLIAKCGEVKVSHWAHRGKRTCDHWWEPETEWHRTWKGHFPAEWQEIVHTSATGEKHIADVKTDQGWVLEFQHSFLNPDERRSRDSFYPKLVWVVDGTRRKRDAIQFSKMLNAGVSVGNRAGFRKVFPDECALMREWSSGQTPVFFDFGEAHRIWWLLPRTHEGQRNHISEFPRAQFVHLHRAGVTETAQVFEKFLADFSDLVAGRTKTTPSQAQARMPSNGIRTLQRRRRF